MCDNSDSISDAQRFELLFQEYWLSLCRVIFRLVGDWDEAEDLALDTFVQLYKRPPEKENNLGGWLYRVATNLGFNALRSRKRRQHYEEKNGYQALIDDLSRDPAEEIERMQEHERVQAVLTQMKPRSAQLLILRHSGLSYAELAEAVDASPGSIGTLLARAEREFEQEYRALGG